jgi:hypothetical protein
VVFLVTSPCDEAITAASAGLRAPDVPPVLPTQPCAPIVTRITRQGPLPAWAVPYEDVEMQRSTPQAVEPVVPDDAAPAARQD